MRTGVPQAASPLPQAPPPAERLRTPAPRPGGWRIALPLAVLAAIALTPVPGGLAPRAWYYFAVFAAVITALISEPLPEAGVGLLGVTAVTVGSRWLLFSPEEQAAAGFRPPSAALEWALAGFANSTVWLVFSAFMFALGYQNTGLGRRIALLLVRSMGDRPIGLAYACVLADLALAPFTPSNTARSAGTLFPLVRSIPPLYDSHPDDPSARRVGGYLLWTSFAASCLTSSLFLTALAPNLLAWELVRSAAHVEIRWLDWFLGAAPFALPLLLALPWLTHALYPPEIRGGADVERWAAEQLAALGPPSRREGAMLAFALLAVTLWIGADRHLDPATVGLLVVALMLVTRVVRWDEMVTNHAAWSTLVSLATMVTLAGGLARTGFISWFAEAMSPAVVGLSPTLAVMSLVTVYFLCHYCFASITPHTTALLPALLAIGMRVPGVPAERLALSLALAGGIMGVLTPYATASAFVYHKSGYIPTAHFWRLGTTFGLLFLAALLLVAVPLLMRA
jgi:L-tartrate/succinate antiporter